MLGNCSAPPPPSPDGPTRFHVPVVRALAIRPPPPPARENDAKRVASSVEPPAGGGTAHVVGATGRDAVVGRFELLCGPDSLPVSNRGPVDGGAGAADDALGVVGVVVREGGVTVEVGEALLPGLQRSASDDAWLGSLVEEFLARAQAAGELLRRCGRRI